MGSCRRWGGGPEGLGASTERTCLKSVQMIVGAQRPPLLIAALGGSFLKLLAFPEEPNEVHVGVFVWK